MACGLGRRRASATVRVRDVVRQWRHGHVLKARQGYSKSKMHKDWDDFRYFLAVRARDPFPVPPVHSGSITRPYFVE